MSQFERKSRNRTGERKYGLWCERCSKKIMKGFWIRKKKPEQTDRDYVVLCEDCGLKTSDNSISMYFKDPKQALDLNGFSKI